MLNVYGYNRKTVEQDTAILEAVQRHHDFLTNMGFHVVMTSLVGSQNYDLDHENSDIDTYSFILPSLTSLSQGKAMEAGIIEVEDGQCNYKDIREALNLLRKTSPNSVEYFTSKYKVYNPLYKELLKEYLEDNTKLYQMVHCNYLHMLNAMAGMAHQLVKRNMPTGKRFGHALRLKNMYYHFLYSANAAAVLEFRPGGDRDMALMAKKDLNPSEEDALAYELQCEEISAQLDEKVAQFKLNEEQKENELNGEKLIAELQLKIFKQYLMETNN